MKKRRNLSPGALTAPLPPVMVTVGDMEKSNVLTVAWTGILATVPPKTYVSIRPSRHSYGMLKESGEFVINLPPAILAREVDFVGIYTGAKMDKFEKCGFTKTASEKVAPPTIAECPLALECRVCEVKGMGSHDVFIADILGVSAHDDLFDEAGRLCLERANLLAYAHGEYFALGEKLGKFGFSTAKTQTKVVKNQRNSPKKEENKGASSSKGASQEASAELKEPFYLAVAKKNNRRGGRRK